ncbi:MAG: hypothetical protein ACKV2T_11470 [Kofleriaceae bacterium]
MRLALLALLSLLPSVALADEIVVARDGTTIAAITRAMKRSDAKAIAARLETPFKYNGAWFTDAACAKRFARAGVLHTKDRDAFARCLARLVPQLSTRESSALGGVILTVEPGIELELAISDGRVRWIGAAGAGDDTSPPMLTAQAFEALRTAGTTLLDDAVRADLEGELAKSNPASAWIRTCVDETGTATRAIASASTPKTGEVFLRATSDWAFKPYVFRKAPLRVCSMSLLTYPASKAPAVETLPRSGSNGARLSTYVFEDDLDLMSSTLMLSSIATIQPLDLVALSTVTLDPMPATPAQVSVTAPDRLSDVNVCIDTNGDVKNVVVLGQNPGDRQRAAKIWRWKRFKPYVANGAPMEACALLQFVVTP